MAAIEHGVLLMMKVARAAAAACLCHPSDIVASQDDRAVNATLPHSPAGAPLTNLAELLVLLQSGADLCCDGEPVTQLEHALQCAALASQAGASGALVAAALLHDLGHLLPTAAATTDDDRHHLVGAHALSHLFGPAVTEPIRLHVDAKRFLVATADGYRDRLSADSLRSLELQGGVMTAAACEAFRAHPYATDALRLRVWDELAKDADAPQQRLKRFVRALEVARHA